MHIDYKWTRIKRNWTKTGLKIRHAAFTDSVQLSKKWTSIFQQELPKKWIT